MADSLISMLRGGQRKLIAVADLVAIGPTMLLLDEPTAGLDAGGKPTACRAFGSAKAGDHRHPCLARYEFGAFLGQRSVSAKAW